MKKYVAVVIVGVVAIGVVLLIQGRSPEQDTPATTVQAPPPGHPGAGEALAHSGKVIETMDSGGYTYIHVDTGEEKLWAAGPETAVEVGDMVAFPTGMQMTDFKSESLDRTFETIYFVPEIRTGEGDAKMPSGHPDVSSGPAAVGMDFTGITVPSGGKSIAALYADRSSLAGKDVVVRGKVVKFTPGVMGKNWIHLRDGTGSEETNDLTVTTDAKVRVGDVVVARGVLIVDKEVGTGYHYEIIIENADVTVEKEG
jgi:hypothetical protein